ncbi:MAG: DUF4352 domain-containing protein [Lachnospiraceae bacterium]|nr:DUF4352 domain-containing protein [Lachnospiraceae bacterium]MCM1241130.1 DUF4352 domain-containing protein [Lachnospiraceae bacterium]MCM1305508.1 DUF4352 domain-containing protein [Butyrivibrio sp.]MCM1343916.1 DUF4352 domain-containing protein [Muribaculaceae bacterium]MCM1412258.1 DUF4352 domain-containing protein [Lachnospiraceae bacterium]
MKKFALLFLATVVTATVLAGCGSNGTLGSSSTSGSSSSTGSSASSSTGSSIASSIASSSSAASTEAGYPDENGNAEGYLGDTMHTYFFDYTVNSAYLCDEYEGYTPADGNEILVADVTVKNTVTSTLPMYDTDFQIQWNDTADDAFGFPITLELNDVLNDQMLPAEYELSINQSVNGLLVYEVPAGNKDFSISYLEMFDDDTTGDVFFVYFSASKQ